MRTRNIRKRSDILIFRGKPSCTFLQAPKQHFTFSHFSPSLSETDITMPKAKAKKRDTSGWRPYAERRLGIGQVEGETHPAAKMTAKYVRALRLRAASLRGTPKAVGFINREAEKKGVTRSAICAALYGDTWTSVPFALKKKKKQRSLH
jgi:hypothetical protein